MYYFFLGCKINKIIACIYRCISRAEGRVTQNAVIKNNATVIITTDRLILVSLCFDYFDSVFSQWIAYFKPYFIPKRKSLSVIKEICVDRSPTTWIENIA